MELNKGQNVASATVVSETARPVKSAEVPQAKNVGNSGYHELPIKEIRKDMIKNFLYLAFAIAVIIGIKISGIDVSKLLSLRL